MSNIDAYRLGAYAGYEAAIAAERERVAAELEKLIEVDHDYFAICAAIEIVKGGEDETNK